ncbi:MAG: radical SAM protein [Nitrospirae bacterium]|nr:radical SAM protein [Nitrospirota bacterium]
MDNMNKLIPVSQNYIAFFLTFGCNLHCPYCINEHSESGAKKSGVKMMIAEDWILATNRFVLRGELPITLQGGEPTLHKGFYQIVSEVDKTIKMDLLTNMLFDVDEFIKRVPVWRFDRTAPYSPIRVSYHPGQNDIDDLKAKTLKLLEKGYKVGVFAIDHPDEEIKKNILKAELKCKEVGIDFRLKEFLGDWEGQLYGTYKYDGCVNRSIFKTCDCRTSEILVNPAGYIFRCHSDLYKNRTPIAHILDEDLQLGHLEQFRQCDYYGDCNPCDVKVKTNRFQIFGHTSVQIKNIRQRAININANCVKGRNL